MKLTIYSLFIATLMFVTTHAISLEKIKDEKSTETPNEPLMTDMKNTSPTVTLMPLLPAQEKEKPTQEEATEEEGDGSIIFEFEDEDGNISTFGQGSPDVDTNEEKDGTTTTEDPVGLSPACLASLCG